jgi:hypothetical protein
MEIARSDDHLIPGVVDLHDLERQFVHARVLKSVSGLFCQWRTNVSLVFSIRPMLLESSAAAPSNETRIAQAPVAERPIALPPARRWSCKCGSRYSP